MEWEETLNISSPHQHATNSSLELPLVVPEDEFVLRPLLRVVIFICFFMLLSAATLSCFDAVIDVVSAEYNCSSKYKSWTCIKNCNQLVHQEPSLCINAGEVGLDVNSIVVPLNLVSAAASLVTMASLLVYLLGTKWLFFHIKVVIGIVVCELILSICFFSGSTLSLKGLLTPTHWECYGLALTGLSAQLGTLLWRICLMHALSSFLLRPATLTMWSQNDSLVFMGWCCPILFVSILIPLIAFFTGNIGATWVNGNGCMYTHYWHWAVILPLVAFIAFSVFAIHTTCATLGLRIWSTTTKRTTRMLAFLLDALMYHCAQYVWTPLLYAYDEVYSKPYPNSTAFPSLSSSTQRWRVLLEFMQAFTVSASGVVFYFLWRNHFRSERLEPGQTRASTLHVSALSVGFTPFVETEGMPSGAFSDSSVEIRRRVFAGAHHCPSASDISLSEASSDFSYQVLDFEEYDQHGLQ